MNSNLSLNLKSLQIPTSSPSLPFAWQELRITLPQNTKLDLTEGSLSLREPQSLEQLTSEPSANWCKSNAAQKAPPSFPQNWKTDGRGRSSGSKRTQFKSGADWRGNAGGRPRALTDAYNKLLAERDEKTGLTGAEKIAKKIIEVAQSGSKNNVAAAREVTRVTEGEVATEGSSANVTAAMLSADVMAMIQRLVGK